jgi:hypothetical protein
MRLLIFDCRLETDESPLALAQNRHGAMSGLSPLLNESRK